MPSWFIHMNVAKKAIENLSANPRVAPILASSGMSAADLSNIAKNNPAYVALGSIGPDLFVFVPDFKPPLGPPIYMIAKFLIDFYDKVDPYIATYQDTVGQAMAEGNQLLNSISGGMLQSLSDVGTQLSNIFMSALEDFVTTQADWWGLMTSGVPAGYDEQSFFWSDMLHYRSTFEFGASLWRNAQTDQERAYALGWMTHIGTDVVGHSYVNEKCGGPYRLHWQRHHVIETHMDAYVYGREFGSQSQYQSLCGAAQHLWIAFNKDGTSHPPSHSSFLNPGSRPAFDPSDANAMKAAWDVDSDMPDCIKGLLVRALQETYPPSTDPTHQTAGAQQQCADHPSILTTGYPTEDDINTAYFYLYKYVKMITTDFYKLQPPAEPPVIPWPPLPGVPGSPEGDGSSDPSLSLWDIICDIFAWLLFLAECLAYLPALVAALIAGPITYPFREVIYQFVELPLYNIWLTLHWLRAITGYATPLPQEITPALHTLGVGFTDNWNLLEAEINQMTGGLLGTPATVTSEPSGRQGAYQYPLDAITDPTSVIPPIQNLIDLLRTGPICKSEGFSEFMRPWRWPARDMEGDAIPTETPQLSGASSPFRAGMDPYVLMTDWPGDNGFRHQLEQATSWGDTFEKVRAGLGSSTPGITHVETPKHLGDPADFSSYVIANLTRNTITNKTKLANFNLDADRGYGFKCWDWKRRADASTGTVVTARPDAYKADGTPPHPTHIYFAPQHAGTGWDAGDLMPHPPESIPDPVQRCPNNPATLTNVAIRYIDIEGKY